MTQPAVTWRQRIHLRGLRRVLSLLVFLAVIEYLVLPQIAGTRAALHQLAKVQPFYLLTGAVLEAASLLSYSLLTRSVLPDQRPSLWWLLRTDLTSLGVSHVAPGGAASASTLRFHLLRQGGTPAEDALVGAAVQGIGSAVVLLVILWLALLASIPFSANHEAYVVPALLGAVVIVAAGVIGWRFHGGRGRALPAGNRLLHRLPRRVRSQAERAARAVSGQLAQLLRDRDGLAVSAGWATANWLLDAASLYVFLAAYGYRANPVELLVGYGLANVAAAVPISPGGLGLMEAILLSSLVGFGAPHAATILGIVSWRLFQFWVPIPVSLLCYLSLRTQGWWSSHDFPQLSSAFGSILAGHPDQHPGAGDLGL